MYKKKGFYVKCEFCGFRERRKSDYGLIIRDRKVGSACKKCMLKERLMEIE